MGFIKGAGNKYGFIPISNDNFTNIAYNDPWFALGQVLSNGWAKNYTQRGLNKILDQYEKELSPTPNTEEIASAEKNVDLENRMKALDAVAGDYKNGKFDALTPTVLNQASDEITNKSGYSFMNNPDNFKGEDEFITKLRNDALKNSGQATNGNPYNSMNNKEALQELGYMPRTAKEEIKHQIDNYAGHLGSGYTNYGSPDKNTGNYRATLNAQQGAYEKALPASNERLANLNAADWLASKKLDMMKMGYDDDIIERELMPLYQKAQGAQSQQDKLRVAGLAAMYQQAIGERRYGDANQIALQVKNIDPETGKFLMQNNPQATSFYATDVAKAAAKTAHDNKTKDLLLTGEITRANHKSATQDNMSYDDNHTGNAMALQKNQLELKRAYENASTGDKVKILMSAGYSYKQAIDAVYSGGGGRTKKGNNSNDDTLKDSIKTIYGNMNAGEGKIRDLIAAGDLDKAQDGINELNNARRKYQYKVSPDDDSQFYQIAAGLNAMVEFKRGNTELANQYLEDVSPEVRAHLGINDQ